MAFRGAGGSSVKSSMGNGWDGGVGRGGIQQPGSSCPDGSLSNSALSYHATTAAKTIKCHYLWTISNYTFLKDLDKFIDSPKFTTPDGTEWFLRIYPSHPGRNAMDGSVVSGYLFVHELKQARLQTKHSGKILSAEDDVQEALKAMERSAKMDCFKPDTESWGWIKLLSNNDLFDEKKKFMLNDSIRVLWHLEILAGVHNSVGSLVSSTLRNGNGTSAVLNKKPEIAQPLCTRDSEKKPGPLRLDKPARSAMRIFIKASSGHKYTLEVKPLDTVRKVKENIRGLGGPLPVQQRLSYDGKLLDDQRTLSACNIREGSTLDMILRLRGGYCGSSLS